MRNFCVICTQQNKSYRLGNKAASITTGKLGSYPPTGQGGNDPCQVPQGLPGPRCEVRAQAAFSASRPPCAAAVLMSGNQFPVPDLHSPILFPWSRWIMFHPLGQAEAIS